MEGIPLPPFPCHFHIWGAVAVEEAVAAPVWLKFDGKRFTPAGDYRIRLKPIHQQDHKICAVIRNPCAAWEAWLRSVFPSPPVVSRPLRLPLNAMEVLCLTVFLSLCPRCPVHARLCAQRAEPSCGGLGA